MSKTLLVIRALWELNPLRSDSCRAGSSSTPASRSSGNLYTPPLQHNAGAVVSDAVGLALCFYWKPVYCLQRSVVTARLLKKVRESGRPGGDWLPALALLLSCRGRSQRPRGKRLPGL